jgi:preprotein translocase subunit SecG
MGVLSVVLIVVFVIIAILLILMVLIQDEHGEGIGGVFGGASSTAFGSRSGNFISKTTTVLGALFLITSFGLALLNRTPGTGNVEAVAKQKETASTTTASTEWWNTEAAPTAAGPGQSSSGTGSDTAPNSDTKQ